MKRDLVFWRSFAVLVAPILLSVLAYNFVKSNKNNKRRIADDIDASSSSTTSMGTNSYDVFLSFCGKDTRNNFVDHLYNSLCSAGIYVFKDDDELCAGEEIGTNLFRAITNSKILIPVLSRNYGSRKWCLEELVQMRECMNSGGVVLPIFYQVEPADVRYQKRTFGKIFSRLSRKHYEEDVAKWKQALQKVASLKGWESERIANGREGELVNIVVRTVLSKLKAFQLDVTEQLVGIDDAVEDILRLLDNNPSATQIVGIHGMGGIGKTTLAKVVYNSLYNQFQHHSFIADIRKSSNCNDISCLQNQLISNILKTKDQVSNKDEGLVMMQSRFKLKKVLILLDDVDDKDQLKYLIGKPDWFEMGSRIIVTTRLSSVLDDVRVNYKYELQKIDEDQSLILFNRHAFLGNYRPSELESLSHNFVSITGGLPLALEIIGSFLCGKDRSFWEDALKKFKEVPHENVQQKLMISYDALNHEERQIFLDTACFFIGTDVRIASYLWDACKFFPKMGIEMLSFASLIKVGDNNELKMHDQLRDLGRKIVRQEDDNVPWNRSRLWVYEEALEVLQSKKENEIKALRLDKNGSSKVMKRENFEVFLKLRFLHVSAVDFVGDFKGLLSELRWLKWERCPETFKATNIHLKKLLILDLSSSNISENWGGWSSIKMEGLKVLNLSWCSDLKSTPNFSLFKSLEMLVLENCENLEKIDPSIGNVKCLISLNVRYCGSLKMLPAELGELRDLEELLLDKTCIQEIPPCIGSLEKLKMLSAMGCRLLTQLPSSMSSLVSLLTLKLNTCKKLQELPDSFQALGNLKHLWLERCYMLKKIPSSIVKLKELVELDLSSTGIKELPESLGELKKLEILRISHSEIEKLPSAIGKLESLQELDASGCHKLEGQIPEDIGGLSSLRTLRLGRANISELPDKLRELSKLDHLDLLYCSQLESPREFPSGLSSLLLTCRSDKLGSLSQPIYLKELTLRCCMSLQCIPDLPSRLRKLRVWKCPKLGRLSNLSHLKYLLELELLQCYGLKELDGLEALESLKKLDLSTSTELSNLDDFEDLESLRYLDPQSSDGKVEHLHAIGGLGQLKSLKVLNISGRKHIQHLDLSQSEQLKQLIVNNCESLDKIEFHDNIKSLERFDRDGCKSRIIDLFCT